MTTVPMLDARTEQANRYREHGWWRDETFLDDLALWARLRPDAPAFVSGRAHDGIVHTVSYRELDEHVLRFACGLHDLGVRPGDVVAFQLPDWWETAALLLACLRVGAIAQPMVPELRAREIERALARTRARVCVTVDSWAGFEHARALAELAPRLPNLRHRVVYGDAAATGALDFHDCLVRGPHRADVSVLPALDPDRPCLVLFTSGSTGEAKGVLHSFNTIYAGARGFTEAATAGSAGPDVSVGTLRISHIAGPLWMVFGPLLNGGTGVFADQFDADGLLDLMDQVDASRLLAPPPRMFQLVEAQRRRPRRLPALHTVASGGTTVPTGLVPAVQDAFGVPLRAVWGMTEVVVGSMVGVDDPPGWSAHSDGRPLAGLEVRVVTPSGAAGTGSLQVRGAALCLGTISDDIDRVSPPTDEQDGWFDTGDLARPDGRGGIRLVGRVADRVYGKHNNFMIPVRDVEDELLRHPRVRDAAIVACRDGELDDVCAVVVPAGEAPTLEELREFLTGRGMTEWFQPTRLECVDELPRDHFGKIRKYQLRARFDPAARA